MEKLSLKGDDIIKTQRLISLLSKARILFFIVGLWTYIDNLLLKGNPYKLSSVKLFGKTTVSFPTISSYQFTIILTIPLFILVLIGIDRFISVLKMVVDKETPFDSDIVSMFRKFSSTILYFGVAKVVISIIGGFLDLYPQKLYTQEIVVLIFPIEFLLGSLIMLGISYILKVGISIKSENDMFI